MGVSMLCQYLITENTSSQIIDCLTTKVLAMDTNVVQTGHFSVDCDTYMSVPELGCFLIKMSVAVALKPYTLVEFVSRGRKRKQRQVDVVPSKWIEFNRSRQRGTTKFLTTIESDEDGQLLHDLVRNLGDPPESWTSYSVNILGDAVTYEKAVEKISVLEVEAHAFSLESGEELEERQSKVLEEVKRQKLLKESAALDDLLAPPPKDVDSDNDAPDSPKSVTSPKKSHTQYSDIDWSDDEKSASTPGEEAVGQDTVPVQLQSSKRSDDKLNGSSILSSGGHKKKDAYAQPQNKKNSPKSVRALMNRKKETSIYNLDLPVIQIPHVESSTEFQTAVLTSLSLMSSDLQQVNRRLDNLEKYLCDKEVISTAANEIDFEAKYNFKLPIEDKPAFVKFNEELSVNKYMKKDVLTMLKSCMDTDNYVITKSICLMLKKFITKAVALEYTAVRKSSKDPRDIFKSCEFCIAIEYTISCERKEKNLEVNDKLLIKGLSDVLCNAIYWEANKEVVFDNYINVN